VGVLLVERQAGTLGLDADRAAAGDRTRRVRISSLLPAIGEFWG
jgi:hypothetical protein